MGDLHSSDGTVAHAWHARDDVSVYRVADYAGADLLAALELCNQMIPAEQRQGTPAEIVRQIQALRRRRSQGICAFEDYHLVAKRASGVCGYMQIFFDPVENLAVVGFLVVRADISLGRQAARVTTRICQEITRKLIVDGNFQVCDWLFLELDDPHRAADERQRRRAARRIARFEAICQQCGLELRLVEFDYVQACLGLPADGSRAERPHLLGCISRGPESCMSGDALRKLLQLIYTRLNPEGAYYGNSQQDERYRSYLDALCAKECARVPVSVRLLSAQQIVSGTPRATRGRGAHSVRRDCDS
jgi:hypothetical protein